MPLHVLLTKYIVRTEEKVNKSNLKTYCKSYIEELGEEEGYKTWFPNKTDRIIQYLKKCSHFLVKTNEGEREKIFGLNNNPTNANSNTNTSLIPSKRLYKYFKF